MRNVLNIDFLGWLALIFLVFRGAGAYPHRTGGFLSRAKKGASEVRKGGSEAITSQQIINTQL
jgi:hypothetical protein